MCFYLEPDNYSRNKIKAELDLFNNPTKSDVKNITGVDTSGLAKKADVARLKPKKQIKQMQINQKLFQLI